jgi:uncharacterized protein (DUF58 family)
MRALRWLRPLARALDWQPLALPGALLAAGSGLALWYYGFRALDLLLLVAALACLAVLAICALAAAATAFVLRRALRELPTPALPERIETEAWLRTGFVLPDWPLPWITLGLRWDEPPHVACRLQPRIGGGAWLEEVRASRRAEVKRIERVIEIRDVFGLTRLRLRDVRDVNAWILPNPGKLRDPSVVVTRTGGDGDSHPAGSPEGDRVDIRRYAPGDSARDVMWKVFARTGILMVRKPERSFEPARQVNAYLVAGDEDEAAAAAARLALESGALGQGWRFGADGTRADAHELAQALHAVAASGDARGPTGLGAFLDAAPAADPCIVFTPASDGAWRYDVQRLAAQHGPRLAFVLGADGVERARVRTAFDRFVYAGAPTHAISERELRGLVAELSSYGGDVKILDRATGLAHDGHGGQLA